MTQTQIIFTFQVFHTYTVSLPFPENNLHFHTCLRGEFAKFFLEAWDGWKEEKIITKNEKLIEKKWNEPSLSAINTYFNSA